MVIAWQAFDVVRCQDSFGISYALFGKQNVYWASNTWILRKCFKLGHRMMPTLDKEKLRNATSSFWFVLRKSLSRSRIAEYNQFLFKKLNSFFTFLLCFFESNVLEYGSPKREFSRFI